MAMKRGLTRRTFLRAGTTGIAGIMAAGLLAACEQRGQAPAAGSKPADSGSKPADSAAAAKPAEQKPAAPAAQSQRAPAAASGGKDVRVGVILPLSGQSATIGQQIRTGAELAIERFKAEGGVKAMGGASIEPIWADSKSTPDGGVAEAERLALRENVAMILGAYQSSVTFPASEVSERNKVPWLVYSSVKDEITQRDFKYVFRPSNMATYDVKEVLDGFKGFKEETGKGPRTMAFLYESTDWPQSTLAAFKKMTPEYGIEIVAEEAYPPKQTDFTAQLLKIKPSNPDLMMVMMYTPEHIIFQKQYVQQGLQPPYGLWSMGAGSEDPAYYKAVSQDTVENMFVQEDWDLYGLKQDWIKGVSDAFEGKLGYPLNAYGAQGYSNIFVVKEALEIAGAGDRDKIRDALTKIDIQQGPALITGYQRIKFDETGQNTFAHGIISQNQKGEHVPIWPKGNRPADAKMLWPVVGS